MLIDFGIDKSVIEGCNIIVASYTYEDYQGDAYVLFEKDGSLYEVYGSHCSCYGLNECHYNEDEETQWKPEIADIESIKFRLKKGSWGKEEGVADAIKAALNI